MKLKINALKYYPMAACMAVMMCCGIVYLWSMFLQPVIDNYGWETSAVTMVSSSIIFLYLTGGFIGGFVIKAKGTRFTIVTGGVLYTLGLLLTSFVGKDYPWLIYITYGLITGIGVGFCYSGTINCMQNWMPQRRGFAAGLAVFSFGLSSMLLSPYIEWLMRSFEGNPVPMTFRTVALTIGVFTIIAGMFCRSPRDGEIEAGSSPAAANELSRRQYTPREVLKMPEFWCIACAIFFTPAAYMIIIPLLKSIAASRGIPEFQATLTVSLTGIASAASRLISPTVSDKLGRTRVTCILALMTMSASLLLINASGWLYTFVVLYLVFAYAGTSGIFPAMCIEAFGAKYSGMNYGMLLFCIALSAPFYTWLSSVINSDAAVTGDYTITFVMSALVCIIPLVSMPLYTRFHKKTLRREAM